MDHWTAQQRHRAQRPLHVLPVALVLCAGIQTFRSLEFIAAGGLPQLLPGRLYRPVARGSSLPLLASEKSEQATETREKFLALLAEKDGDWRDEEISKLLEDLEAVNPTKDPAQVGEYQDGEWVQVSAPDYNFAGEKGSQEATLGALSFNMYEPRDMMVRVDKTTQVVAPLSEEEGTRRWDITFDLSFIDEKYPSFKAKLTSFGQIKPDKDDNDLERRLRVKFVGGELKPELGGDPELLKQWQEIMSSAQKDKKFSIGDALKGALMKFAMGFEAPSGVAEDGSISWSMQRPPEGFTDVLYMDDKLRVTKGNRGTVVAVVRDP